MTLREKQSAFAALLPRLIARAMEMGFEVTLGEAYRPPEQAELMAKQGKGIKNSTHIIRLAIDLNLFKDGVYLESTKAHQELGEWWEEQSIDGLTCCWGGRFRDGNHYSIEHEGRR
jgi:hypothetical protein